MTDIDYRTRLGYGYNNPEWLRCPSSYIDTKTRIINKLIHGLYRDDMLSKNSTLRRLYLIRNYNNRYTIVFELDGEYRNNDIISWILINTVDKILEWWDITNRNNLDIEYITRGRRPINQNYYQVMWESFTNKSKFRGVYSDNVDERHPRFRDMCRWMYNHNPREYDGHMNRFGPYGYEQQMIERQQELYQNQMSLRMSNYPERSNSCEEIELRNVTVTQRVTKLNKLLNKLKL